MVTKITVLPFELIVIVTKSRHDIQKIVRSLKV